MYNAKRKRESIGSFFFVYSRILIFVLLMFLGGQQFHVLNVICEKWAIDVLI